MIKNSDSNYKVRFIKPASQIYDSGHVVFKHKRVNPEHKSCFKRVFCFKLHSFSVAFSVDENVIG